MKLQKGDKLYIGKEEYIFVSHSDNNLCYMVEKASQITEIDKDYITGWTSKCENYRIENEHIFFTLTFASKEKEDIRIECDSLDKAIQWLGTYIELDRRLKDAGISMSVFGCGCCGSPDISISFSDGYTFESESKSINVG